MIKPSEDNTGPAELETTPKNRSSTEGTPSSALLPTTANPTIGYSNFFQTPPTLSFRSASSPSSRFDIPSLPNWSLLGNPSPAFATLIDLTALPSVEPISSSNSVCSAEDFIRALADDNIIALQQLSGWERFMHGRDPQGLTPLHLTAANGCIHGLTLLLQKGLRPNVANDQGWTPLHLAVCADEPLCVEVLLQNAAPVDAADEEGCTPLHLAANNGQTSLLLRLLAKGATVTRYVRLVGVTLCRL